jgi:hypothetical protein
MQGAQSCTMFRQAYHAMCSLDVQLLSQRRMHVMANDVQVAAAAAAVRMAVALPATCPRSCAATQAGAE